MPAKTKAAKSFRKNTSSNRLPLFYQPPSSRHVTLTFNQRQQFAEAVAGGGAFHFYTVNGAYDLDTQLASTNTAGFNQWSQFYANYRVHRVRFNVECIVQGASQGYGMVGLVPRTGSAVLPGVDSWWAQPYTVKKAITPVGVGGRNMATLDFEEDLWKIAHVSKNVYFTDMDYSATTSNNPVRAILVALCVQGNGAAAVLAIVAQVRITLDVEFFNPVLLSA